MSLSSALSQLNIFRNKRLTKLYRAYERDWLTWARSAGPSDSFPVFEQWLAARPGVRLSDICHVAEEANSQDERK